MLILQTLAEYHADHFNEPIKVSAFALVESECLFIKVTEQVKRFDTDIRALDRSKAAGSNSKLLTGFLEWNSGLTFFCFQKPSLHVFAL